MSFQDLLQILTNIATILGIPIAIIVFLNEKAKERKEREYGTYNALDEKYLEFLRLVMEYPELDMFDIPLEKKTTLTPEQQIQQIAMFEILISLFERAALMYRDQSDEIKKTQWEGWNSYIEDWAKRTTFQELWERRGDQYEKEFVNYMQGIISNTKKSH
jgi:hypothetical protein